ncbi:hypothetical protein OTU49_013662, partial [Cherax quadricarinatus]
MFACFGLKARHKRLSPAQSEVELCTPLTGSPRSTPVHRTPHGTPLPRRASFRRKKNKRPSEVHNFDYPVKAARPAGPTSGPRGPHLGHNGAGQQQQLHPAPHADQLRRLEAQVAARVAEVKVAREERDQAGRGLEALTVLIHHLTST